MPLRDKKKQVFTQETCFPCLTKLSTAGEAAYLFGTTTNCVPCPRLTSRRVESREAPALTAALNSETVGDWFAIHLDDDVALLETGSRCGRICVDVGDNDALRPFGSLQLLAEIRRQGLD